jgi:GH35 family endo-1,4-beta-xylanase
MLTNVFLGLALMAPVAAFAVDLPEGTPAFPAPALDALVFSGGESAGKLEKVKVEGQPFQEALRLSTFELTLNKWDIQAQAPLPVAVKKGDVLLAEFSMRAVQTQAESGEALSEFVFERLGDPWTKAVEYSLSAGPQWKKFSIPFAAVEDLAAGKSHVSFRMGYGRQVFELAGLTLTNYGAKVKVGDLPQTLPTYDGMDPVAPWRKAAAERIERIRKGDLSVAVLDAQGSPVPGAHVAVRMKRSAFPFGSGVVAAKIAGSAPADERYRNEVARLFNRVVFENDLKWGPWEEGATGNGYYRRKNVETAVQWLSAHGLDIRGHNLVWPNWEYLPARLQMLKNDSTALEQAVEDHIQEEVSTMRGKLAEWDVVNEPITNHQLMDILGKQALVTWYNKVRETDPNVLLFLNDYPSPDTPVHLKDFDEIVRYLLDNSAPLQGIGLQSHVGRAPWPIPGLLRMLDTLGAHGIPVEITEYDTMIENEALDAQFFNDFLTAIYSHPAVSGFLMWGFWDGSHWRSHAPIFRKDWTEKPSGQVYQQLILHDWRTDAEGDTAPDGTYQLRGFCGEYEITAKSGDKSLTVPAKLTKDGCRLSLVLK